MKLVAVFGGDYIRPGNCADLVRQFRDRAIMAKVKAGLPTQAVAFLFDVSEQHVADIAKRGPGWRERSPKWAEGTRRRA